MAQCWDQNSQMMYALDCFFTVWHQDESENEEKDFQEG
jgi:hypothetical protein